MNPNPMLQRILNDRAIRRVAADCLAVKLELDAMLTVNDIIVRAVSDAELEGRTGRDAVLLTVMEYHEGLAQGLFELKANRTAACLGTLGQGATH
jgi:hypothetical protein